MTRAGPAAGRNPRRIRAENIAYAFTYSTMIPFVLSLIHISHELVQAGKHGIIFLINRDQMTTNNLHYCQTNCNDMDPEILEELPQSNSSFWMFSLPAYLNGTVYFCGVQDNLKAFPLTNGTLATSPSETSSHSFGFPGGTPAASASGNANGIILSLIHI